MSLRATEGVVNELNGHLGLSLAYMRNRDVWEGNVPLVYEDWFANRSGDGNTFSKFVEGFRGRGTSGEEEIAFFLTTPWVSTPPPKFTPQQR